MPDHVEMVGLIFINSHAAQTGGLSNLKAVEKKLDVPKHVLVVDDLLRSVKTLLCLIHCCPPQTHTPTTSSHRLAKACHQHQIR